MSEPARLTAAADCRPTIDRCNPDNHGPKHISSPFHRPDRPEPMALSNADYMLLVSIPQPPSPSPTRLMLWGRTRLSTLLMGDAGLRAGEVVGLLTSDVYYNSRPTKATLIRAEISKSGRARTIPLSTALQEALSQWDAIHTPPLSAGEPGPLIHGPHRRVPLTTRSIQRDINIASQATLGHVIHPHILRHTFATRLSKVTDLKTVQELLGHVDLRSTQVYLTTTFEDKQQAINDMGKPRSRRDQ